jgi:hypothetical protein
MVFVDRRAAGRLPAAQPLPLKPERPVVIAHGSKRPWESA